MSAWDGSIFGNIRLLHDVAAWLATLPLLHETRPDDVILAFLLGLAASGAVLLVAFILAALHLVALRAGAVRISALQRAGDLPGVFPSSRQLRKLAQGYVTATEASPYERHPRRDPARSTDAAHAAFSETAAAMNETAAAIFSAFPRAMIPLGLLGLVLAAGAGLFRSDLETAGAAIGIETPVLIDASILCGAFAIACGLLGAASLLFSSLLSYLGRSYLRRLQAELDALSRQGAEAALPGGSEASLRSAINRLERRFEEEQAARLAEQDRHSEILSGAVARLQETDDAERERGRAMKALASSVRQVAREVIALRDELRALAAADHGEDSGIRSALIEIRDRTNELTSFADGLHHEMGRVTSTIEEMAAALSAVVQRPGSAAVALPGAATGARHPAILELHRLMADGDAPEIEGAEVDRAGAP